MTSFCEEENRSLGSTQSHSDRGAISWQPIPAKLVVEEGRGRGRRWMKDRRGQQGNPEGTAAPNEIESNIFPV